MATPRISTWTDPPKMDMRAPEPSFAREGDTLWLAYRTNRGDHFAVLRFIDFHEVSFGEPGDQRVRTYPCSFHNVHDEAATPSGWRRWLIVFRDDALELTARRAEIVVRAIQAPSADAAIASVRA